MSAAAYNRGTKCIARATDADMPAIHARADRQAHKDEADRLRAQVAKLERDLARARRCIAELRRSKEERVTEARAEASSSAAAITTLCRLAFSSEVAS
jgi:phage shock protein A